MPLFLSGLLSLRAGFFILRVWTGPWGWCFQGCLFTFRAKGVRFVARFCLGAFRLSGMVEVLRFFGGRLILFFVFADSGLYGWVFRFHGGLSGGSVVGSYLR